MIAGLRAPGQLSLRARVFAVLLLALVAVQVLSFAAVGSLRGLSARHLANDLIAADARRVQSQLLALPAPARTQAAQALERASYGWHVVPASPALPASTERLLHELAQRLAREPQAGQVQPVRWGNADAVQLPLDQGQGLLVVFSTGLPRSVPALDAVLAYLALVTLGVAGVAWAAVAVATRPLARAAADARTLADRLDGPPLAEDGPPELRAMARSLNALRGAVRHQLEARTQILAAVTHDLKTPITRLQLRASALPDEATRGKIEADLEAMAALVDEGLAYARSEHVDEAMAPVDLEALIENLVEQYVDQGLDCRYVAGPLPPVPAAPRALARLLQNLVDNALRYGGHAEIEARVGLEAADVRVADRGPGVAPADLERLFEPFVRGDASRARASGGTGLGLAIARNLARAHGGRVWLEPREGGGLVAIVRWPIRRDGA